MSSDDRVLPLRQSPAANKSMGVPQFSERRRRSQVLRLRMLGGLSVSRDGRAVSGALAQPRRLAVIALLARAGPAGAPRDKIVATLWPDLARNFFEAAVAEDSLFALAQYYAALDAGNLVLVRQRLERARQLASRASERERLTIMAGWAGTMALPSLRPIAETLATRYPTEVAGHLNLGIALVNEGRHLEALAPLERIIAMDSLGLHRATAACGACDAFQWMVGAYQLADSPPRG